MGLNENRFQAEAGQAKGPLEGGGLPTTYAVWTGVTHCWGANRYLHHWGWECKHLRLQQVEEPKILPLTL